MTVFCFSNTIPDNKGEIAGLSYNNTPYYYVKNLQGDIIKLIDKDCKVVVQYSYDAWGKIVSLKDGNNKPISLLDTSHIGNINPYRYRGYYYDTESKLYYLQSRYYDAEVGRFVNGDMPEILLSEDGNLYAYCNNNSINCIDSFGYSATAAALAVSILGSTKAFEIALKALIANFWNIFIVICLALVALALLFVVFKITKKFLDMAAQKMQADEKNVVKKDHTVYFLW